MFGGAQQLQHDRLLPTVGVEGAMYCAALRRLSHDHEQITPRQRRRTEPVEAQPERDQVVLDSLRVLVDQRVEADDSPTLNPLSAMYASSSAST